jgi:Na+-transporting NADH:ubiquinone oxidoreductase subunit A
LFGWSGGHGKHRWSTSQHGRFSGMIPLPVFETVVPMDILPAALFRALLVKDTDQAQALGCLELDEEDLALCSYLCPAKTDYGGALRSNLDLIERHG